MSSSPKMSVCFFVFQVGKESGANVICRRRRNRRSTGRGEGKIGATLGGRGGDRTKYQELTGPCTYRPCCTGRRTFISCHTKSYLTLWLVGPRQRQGKGEKDKHECARGRSAVSWFAGLSLQEVPQHGQRR